MILNLHEIPDGHSTGEQAVTMTEEQVALGAIASTVSCHYILDRMDSEIFIRIHFSSAVSVQCSRCLKPFLYPVQGECAVILHQRSGVKTDGDTRDNDDDEEEIYYFSDADSQIDIRQTIYDEIMIRVALAPRCRQDCPGIPVEEVSRRLDTEKRKKKREKSENQQQKQHEQEGLECIDPRWEELKKLKDRFNTK
ncbi:MAG: DUF177 domain-containing protein [Chitinivibrionales bacterium]|nr:DUF177 domain-containing protein [Chitinivibrionales bacterium]